VGLSAGVAAQEGVHGTSETALGALGTTEAQTAGAVVRLQSRAVVGGGRSRGGAGRQGRALPDRRETIAAAGASEDKELTARAQKIPGNAPRSGQCPISHGHGMPCPSSIAVRGL